MDCRGGIWTMLAIAHFALLIVQYTFHVPHQTFHSQNLIWDIDNLIHHDLMHDTYFRNKIPIVWHHYYTCSVQIVFSSIITLIAINYSFLFPCFFFLHSRWYLEVLCGNVTFLSDRQKYNKSWFAICSNCRYQYLWLHSPNEISQMFCRL